MDVVQHPVLRKPRQAARKIRRLLRLRHPGNPVKEYVTMRELLNSGRCRSKADIARKANCSRTHVTHIFLLESLAADVIETLAPLGALPFRISWRWLVEELRHLPQKDQLPALMVRGGYLLRKLLKALQTT